MAVPKMSGAEDLAEGSCKLWTQPTRKVPSIVLPRCLREADRKLRDPAASDGVLRKIFRHRPRYKARSQP